MGWKGALRAARAAARAAERDARRRQRELERRRQQLERMAELERAAYEVECYENRVQLLRSLHLECSPPVDWNGLVAAEEPRQPERSNAHEKEAQEKKARFRPGLLDRLLRREASRRAALEQEVARARQVDDADYKRRLEAWSNLHDEWKEEADLARRVLESDPEALVSTIKAFNPFSQVEIWVARLDSRSETVL